MRKTVLLCSCFLLFSLTILQAQPTTGAAKLAAWNQQKQMLAKSPYKNLEWRLTGPDNKGG